MFNWLKKDAAPKKNEPELEIATIQSRTSITPPAIGESEAFKIQGSIHVSNGKLEDAAECFRKAIVLNPDYAEAYANLGWVFRLQGKLNDAVALCRKAVLINPNLLPPHLNIGVALMGLGQADAAEESFRRVIALSPEHPVALQYLGMIAAQRSDFPQAETLLHRALELEPGYAEAHNSLGNLLQLTNRFPEAEASYHRALELQPDYAEAHNNLGTLLKKVNRLPEAEGSYRRALELNSDFADAHVNMGTLLMEAKHLSEAEACYRRALELRPDSGDAQISLGTLLMQAKRFPEAEACYRRALELQPDSAYAHNNLGILLQFTNRLPEAEASYRRSLQLQPDYAQAHNNLGGLLLEAMRLTEAEASFRRALKLRPDYADAYCNLGVTLQKSEQLEDAVVALRQAIEIRPDYFEAHSNLIFTLDLMVGVDIASLQEERKRWDAAHAAHLLQRQTRSNSPSPERRLRIGYVSADFMDHSALKVFGCVLTQYDRSQFDVFAYSNLRGKGDTFTELLKQNVTVWRNIAGLTDEAATEMIRQDEIDILVDLSGHSAGNRLLVFARKPAPIQITAWGYATGTGLRAMDVFFTDPVMVPPQEKQYFTEQIRYLPNVVGSFFNEPFPEVNELPALSDGVVTFGSLNRLAKITEETYSAWAGVLLAVPYSRLLIKTPELKDAANRERVLGHFTKAGVESDRIIMLGKTSWYEHMQAYNQIDIVLDPFPHGGGVTALEGLMMGVPIITLRWPTMVGRLSASIMTTLGLTDWIAETQEQYITLAKQKAGDLQSLAELRRQLRGIFNSSVIGDQVAYTRAVEQEYRHLWREWCASST